jgi:hypothetical protein
MAWRETAPMRSISTGARWMLRALWGWITLQSGSRPRRIARKLLVASARFILAWPLLARILEPALDRFPRLKSRVFAAFPMQPGLVSSERERFVHARLKAALEKRLS